MFDQLHLVYQDPNTAVSKRGLGRDRLHLNNLGLQHLMEYVFSNLGMIYLVPAGTGPKSEELPKDQPRKCCLTKPKPYTTHSCGKRKRPRKQKLTNNSSQNLRIKILHINIQGLKNKTHQLAIEITKPTFCDCLRAQTFS